MDYEAMPRIRLEVEHMKHSIMSYIGANNSDLGEALNVEITKALESYPWQSEVTKIVHDELTSRIKEHFTFGEGRKAVVAAVKEGFDSVLNDSGT